MRNPNKPRGWRWLPGLTVAALLSGATTVPAQVDIFDGLVAHWALDDNYEDSVADFDGTPMGTDPIPFVTGKPGFGKAIKLNGEDQYVEITGGEPDDLAFEAGSISIGGWFKVDAFDTSWQALIAKGEGSNWRVARRSAEGGIAYAGGATDTPTGTDVNDGEWHHFVAITDADAVNFGTAVYIDGELDTIIEAAPVLASNGSRVMIGENPGARGREWEGELDDLAIWNRVLRPEEITALYNGGAGRSIASFRGVQIQILGVGTEALLGSDLTDPENDGLETPEPNGSNWNWAGITASHEPKFGAAEAAFNIFDNRVGGGNDKWCCDDPTPDNPVWVAVEFAQPINLYKFTVTSGNDTPDRDPTDWAIQGSNDGSTYTDIYHSTGTPVPWTERNQVVLFTLPDPAPAYRFIRYIAYDTPAPLHQLNEIEYFVRAASISNIRGGITTFSFKVNDEGSAVVDPASVRLVLDGANIDLGTLTKVNGVIDAVYTPPTPFLPRSVHTYQITATDNLGNNITASGSVTTPTYALLTAADKVTADTSKPGFIWRVHQNDAFQANDGVRMKNQLAGLLGENRAEPYNQGVALDIGVAESGDINNLGNLPVRFEIATVINMSQQEGDTNGEFTPDDQMPGIPGQDFSTDGIAGEVLTFIQLPAGQHTFIVNSDDDFQSLAGNLQDVFRRQIGGQFTGGRGAADTAYTVFVQEAGVYAFQTYWSEGGGGANIEWKTEKADGTRVLINDTANGGFPAYRASTGGALTAVTSVSPAPNAAAVAPDANFNIVITEGAQAVDLASVRLTVNNSQVTPTVNKTGSTITVTYDPPQDFRADSNPTASLTFSAGGASRTDSWTFRVPPVTRDSVAQRAGFILGAAAHTADAGGRTGQPGDYAMNFGGRNGNTVYVPDVSFLNTATAGQALTFSHWQKLNSVVASSAFWVNSPSSNNGTRGWQAHVPWSDSTIYFDTSGCCDADITRINLNIADFPGYSGDPSWWQEWHHLVFLKKDTGDKEIWIDGEFFHVGFGDPLKTDWTDMYIGAQSTTANTINGVIDDLAIFRTALTEAQIKALASGTAPDAVTGNPGLLAHWAFNDPPAPVGSPAEFTAINVSGGNLTLEWTGGGTLQTAPAVTGPWTGVAGATSPYSTPANAAAAYFRVEN